MDKIRELTDRLVDFRRRRDWEQFHRPKDLAMSISIEAAELLEHFQWKDDNAIERYINSSAIEEIREEAADIAIYLMLLCRDLKIDMLEAVDAKIKKNEEKYPVEKSKGRADKYHKL